MPIAVLEHLFVASILMAPPPPHPNNSQDFESWLLEVTPEAWQQMYARLERVSPTTAHNWLCYCLEATERFICCRGYIMKVPAEVN